MFWGLGNHIALMGWVKNDKTTEDRLRSVHTMAFTMIEVLRFPPPVISEFKKFLREKVDLDRQSRMEELAERMLALRNLSAVTIRNKFGEREERIFQFGFTLTNLVYMCENPSIVMGSKNLIQDTLSALVKESQALGLPKDPLKESFDIYRKATNMEGFTELYSKLCKCVVMYEEAFEKR
jgi:hypothetical protein